MILSRSVAFFIIAILGCAAMSVTAGPATTQTVGEPQRMDNLWADLEKEEPWSSRALLDFSDKPAETVAYFKEHLKPLKIEQKELDDLLSALGSDDEKVWKPAFDKLEYFDPRLNVDLATLIQNADDQPGRNRLIEVLCNYSPGYLKGKTVQLRGVGDGYNFYTANLAGQGGSSWWAENKISRLTRQKKQWVRASRAIVLLQHIGSPDAIALLKDMATGNPQAEPTIVAKVALDSLRN
jgi:hypothetical protein